jgi:hypothetical protein
MSRACRRGACQFSRRLRQYVATSVCVRDVLRHLLPCRECSHHPGHWVRLSRRTKTVYGNGIVHSSLPALRRAAAEDIRAHRSAVTASTRARVMLRDNNQDVEPPLPSFGRACVRSGPAVALRRCCYVGCMRAPSLPPLTPLSDD